MLKYDVPWNGWNVHNLYKDIYTCSDVLISSFFEDFRMSEKSISKLIKEDKLKADAQWQTMVT